jgi:hypothetical protein
MKLTSRVIGSAVVLVLGLSLNAWAGIIRDTDSDLVPDVFDNCSDRPNGPHDPLNQTDDDADGFGTACDCDFTQDNIVLGDDIVSLFHAFNTSSPVHDVDGDGIVLGSDFVFCIGPGWIRPGPGRTAE